MAFFVALLTTSAIAQQNISVLDEQRPIIEGLISDSESLARQIEENQDNDAKLVEIRLKLEALAEQLLQSAAALSPRLQEVKARLEQLGPVPGPDEPPEPEVASEERAQLSNERAEINALIGQAEDASVAVSKMIDQIANLRRDLFANTLTERYDISFAFGKEMLSAFGAETAKLYNMFYQWMSFTLTHKLRSVLIATFMSLAGALIIFVYARRYFAPIMVADPSNENPSYLSRLTIAFWSTLLPTLALLVFFISTLVLYGVFNLLRADIGQILGKAFEVIAVVFFINRLSHAVASPRLSHWRLVPIHASAARKLVWLATATGLVTGLDFLLTEIFDVLGSPLQLRVATDLVANTIVGLFVLMIASVRPLSNEDGSPRQWPRIVRLPLYLLGAAIILTTMLGYVGLASFISQQAVITSGIVATMYLGFLSASAVAAEGAFQHTVFGNRIGKFFGLSEEGVDQIGLLSGLLVYLVVLVIGIPAILLNWGFQFGDIQTWVIRAFSQINIGSVSFSIGGILTGIFVFFVGFLATRWFQRWLDGSVLSRSRIDSGVRNSVRVGIGYAGIAVAALIGISAAGIDLSNLALVAGALSLGIGFGMQNIVSNFVSGLILLAERPFKVGDWIIAGGTEGTVRRINVRATEIETFQRQTVILPNSDLINQAVGNWTHRNRLGRVDILVGVAYGSDVRKVRDILSDLANNHPMVNKNPAPAVAFKDFGASSLDFELRMYLYDILNTVTVQNDIRFGIIEAFEREGIEIPFPQRDLHIKSGLPGMKEEKSEKPEPARRRRQAAKPAEPQAGRPRRSSRRRMDPDD